MANIVDPDQTAPIGTVCSGSTLFASYMSSMFWVHAVCFYPELVSDVMQLLAADDFSRRHFQMHFFLGALRPYSVCASSEGSGKTMHLNRLV